MVALALKLGPYAAIAALSLLLYASHARNGQLSARLDAQRSEFNAQAAGNAADAARVALHEVERAVTAERERWQSLVTASNTAAAAAKRDRDTVAARAADLQATIDDIYARDDDASTWGDTRLPATIRDSLRD